MLVAVRLETNKFVEGVLRNLSSHDLPAALVAKDEVGRCEDALANAAALILHAVVKLQLECQRRNIMIA